jgi:hypothetical protein
MMVANTREQTDAESAATATATAKLVKINTRAKQDFPRRRARTLNLPRTTT